MNKKWLIGGILLFVAVFILLPKGNKQASSTQPLPTVPPSNPVVFDCTETNPDYPLVIVQGDEPFGKGLWKVSMTARPF